ncbi:protein eyes shut homolog [Varanus komodoensis]|uniref:protein eyes shut homolog n=1 Tax=Varanus komodoensis TaxID=61221 RepID=UPI001CF7BD61|nr:protein eyes shut homolog [Varanus komodoensis]
MQNQPGLGYTCYCEPGFVGRSCELNYNDCLIQTCPAGFLCVDGINDITCLPVVPQRDQIIPETGVSPTEALERGLPEVRASLQSSDTNISQTSTDFSYIQYQGDSYMKFQGFRLYPQNNITLEFQTSGYQGVILYIEQNPTTMGQFLIQLSVKQGTLQYQFACDDRAAIRNISTNFRVDDGQKYNVHVRQDSIMCEAELTILGVTTKTSMPSNNWSPFVWQETGPIFIGGLPENYTTKQVTPSVYNFSGCIEVTGINNMGPFTFSNAVDKNNIDSCRSSFALLFGNKAVNRALSQRPLSF